MKAIAEYFGYEQDVQQYADDAKQVGDAIVNHAWDEWKADISAMWYMTEISTLQVF